MSDFEKLINASDLIEWIIETDPDWCVGSVRCIIDHIDKLPSAQPEPCEDTISRQDAIDYCYALINAENPSDPSDEWNYSQERINQTEVILHHLEVMPSAQPDMSEYSDKLWKAAYERGKAEAHDEIVCCEDCKNRGDDDCPMRFIEWVEYDDDGYIEHDDIIHDYTKDDGFCDRAERRTDESD